MVSACVEMAAAVPPELVRCSPMPQSSPAPDADQNVRHEPPVGCRVLALGGCISRMLVHSRVAVAQAEIGDERHYTD